MFEVFTFFPDMGPWIILSSLYYIRLYVHIFPYESSLPPQTQGVLSIKQLSHSHVPTDMDVFPQWGYLQIRQD